MRERRGAYRVWLGKLRERGHSENLGIDGRILLKFIFKKQHGFSDWIDMPEDRDKWRVYEHNNEPFFPKDAENFLSG
jgi:hypothetical protein